MLDKSISRIIASNAGNPKVLQRLKLQFRLTDEDIAEATQSTADGAGAYMAKPPGGLMQKPQPVPPSAGQGQVPPSAPGAMAPPSEMAGSGGPMGRFADSLSNMRPGGQVGGMDAMDSGMTQAPDATMSGPQQGPMGGGPAASGSAPAPMPMPKPGMSPPPAAGGTPMPKPGMPPPIAKPGMPGQQGPEVERLLQDAFNRGFQQARGRAQQ